MRNTLLVLFLFQFSCYGQIQEESVKALFKNIAFFVTSDTVREKFNGKEYEIWYKDMSTGEFLPRLNSITGSAFFISKHGDAYLVTAEHVIAKTTLESTILLVDTLGKTIQVRLGDIIPGDRLNWTIHSISDVAVHPIEVSKLLAQADVAFFPVNQIETKLEAPFRTRELIIYGYPLDIALSPNIVPVSKICRTSTDIVIRPRFDQKKKNAPFFFLDDPSIGGFSGGPVYEIPQLTGFMTYEPEYYKLRGLVHGTIGGAGGFAAIVPAKHILETVEMAPGFEGLKTFKYENGNEWSRRIYKNGNPWTVLSNFKANGEEQEMGTLKDGTGSLNIYDLESNLIETSFYKNGHLIEVKFFEPKKDKKRSNNN